MFWLRNKNFLFLCKLNERPVKMLQNSWYLKIVYKSVCIYHGGYGILYFIKKIFTKLTEDSNS